MELPNNTYLYLLKHYWEIKLYNNETDAIRAYRKYEKNGASEKNLQLRKVLLEESQVMNIKDELNSIIPELKKALCEIPYIFNFYNGPKVLKIKTGVSVHIEHQLDLEPEKLLVAKLIFDKRIKEFHKTHKNIDIKMRWQKQNYGTLKKDLTRID